MNNQVVDKKKQPESRPKPWWTWLALLLIPISFLLPLFGENIQMAYIGEEDYCCAMFTDPEYVAEVEHARELHWLSNLIIGGGIILAIAVLVLAAFILYKFAIPCISHNKIRILIKVILGIIIFLLGALLLSTLIYYITQNYNYYHSVRTHAPTEPIYWILWR